MEFTGWTANDFAIFRIAGFEERMAEIRAHVQPKLDALGRDLVPLLQEETGTEWFYHVAKHLRRSVNPPTDTWVAFNRVKRGYKATTHFDVGLSALGPNVAVVVKPECTERDVFAAALTRNARALTSNYKGVKDLLIGDVPNAPVTELLRAGSAKTNDWKVRADWLLRRKQYEFEAGYRFSPEDAAGMSPEAFVETALDRMRSLMPLYLGGVQPRYKLPSPARPAAV